jgi:hypothetical protein
MLRRKHWRGDLESLAAAYLRYLRHGRTAERWTFDRVSDITVYGTDPERAWTLASLLVRRATSYTLPVVAAGALEDTTRRFGGVLVDRIESLAQRSPKFRNALGMIWMRSGELPPTVEARIVTASGGCIRPLPARAASES